MRKMRNLSILVILSLMILLVLSACTNNAPVPAPEPAATSEPPAPEPAAEPEPEPEEPALSETVTFMAEDGLEVTADLYKTEDENAPYIILFHMSGSSRREYIEIAPRLNEMGYNCLAVDSRPPSESMEKTAWADVKAALAYVKEELTAEKIIIWGSSYTASLGLILGSEFSEDVSAILAFSPGEYFSFNGNTVGSYAANIKCPVFITAEGVPEYPNIFVFDYAGMARALYDKIPAENKVLYIRDDIPAKHGSNLLLSNAADNELYWEQVIVFLNSVQL